jgi:hypothetical protein
MWVVRYRWKDCDHNHDGDDGPYRKESEAREQARLHNGLCPHYGVPVACATVEEVELPPETEPTVEEAL